MPASLDEPDAKELADKNRRFLECFMRKIWHVALLRLNRVRFDLETVSESDFI
jgi:hypothetical protein